MFLLPLLQLHVFLQRNKATDVYHLWLILAASRTVSAAYAIFTLSNGHHLCAGSSCHLSACETLCTPNFATKIRLKAKYDAH